MKNEITPGNISGAIIMLTMMIVLIVMLLKERKADKTELSSHVRYGKTEELEKET